MAEANRPRLLDLFCGAGGCARGYQRAGFYVVGVDNRPQPRYAGDEFVKMDALLALENLVHNLDLIGCLQGNTLDQFDAIHASPPCQAFTSLRHLGNGAGRGALDLVADTRELLLRAGLPYVIENVPGAPLRHPYTLCGSSFGLGVRRHRLFEINFPMLVPSCLHGISERPIAVYGDHPEDSQRENLNRARTLEEGQEAMGIDWMPWRSLTQAIPPAYTEHIGGYLMAEIRQLAA